VCHRRAGSSFQLSFQHWLISGAADRIAALILDIAVASASPPSAIPVEGGTRVWLRAARTSSSSPDQWWYSSSRTRKSGGGVGGSEVGGVVVGRRGPSTSPKRSSWRILPGSCSWKSSAHVRLAGLRARAGVVCGEARKVRQGLKAHVIRLSRPNNAMNQGSPAAGSVAPLAQLGMQAAARRESLEASHGRCEAASRRLPPARARRQAMPRALPSSRRGACRERVAVAAVGKAAPRLRPRSGVTVRVV